jgi:O-antigen/teichoic acid export membrane protein
LVKPFWIFGIDRTVQNIVGAEQYGFYFALFNFTLILNMLLDLGITSFNNRNIAQNTHLLNKYFSNIILLRFILGLFYFVITITIAWLWDYNWIQIKFLMILAFNQFLSSFVLYLRSNLTGLHLFKTDSIISVLDRIIMIIICSILLWSGITNEPFKIEWFALAQTFAYSTTAFISFVLVLIKSGKIKIRFDLQFSLAILKKSYPYAILTILMASYNRFDAILLERLLEDGSRQAGIFAQAFRILDAASMFALLFAGLLLPIFSKMIKQKQDVGQLVQLSFVLIAIPAIIIALTSLFFNNNIMELLYHKHVSSSANIFAVLMFGFIPISTTYIFGTLLTANGSLKQLNIMATFGVIINVGVNIILIPKFFALGAAISSLITQSITALIQVIIAYKLFKLKLNYKFLFSLLVFILGVFLLGLIMKSLPFNWILNYISMIILSIAFAFTIGLIKIKSIYEIIKYDK